MSETTLAVQRPLVKASSELSLFLGMEVGAMIDALKSQCFKGKRPDEVTDAQLATYISTANALKLNPLLPGQMYAYPDRQGGGVTVMIGPDGVFTLLSNHTDVVGQKDGGPAFWTEHGKDADGKDTCTGYINHKVKGLLKKTIWVDEWVVSSNPNWQSRRHHMAEIRALKQTARMVIHGLPVDSDEHTLGEMLNVTGSVPADQQGQLPGGTAPVTVVERPAPPKRAAKGAAAVSEAEKGKAIDVVTTPAGTTPPPAPPPAAEPPKAEPPRVETPPPAPPPKPPEKVAEKTSGPRTTLIGEEEFVCTVEVKKVFALIINVANQPTPSVQAVVEGDFSGPVFEFNGAKPDGAGDLVAGPVWKVGAKVKLLLFGRVNKNTGAVMPVVRKVEPVEGSPNTAIDAG